MGRFTSKEIKTNFFSFLIFLMSTSFLSALAADYFNKYFKHVSLRHGNVLVIKLTFNRDDQN